MQNFFSLYESKSNIMTRIRKSVLIPGLRKYTALFQFERTLDTFKVSKYVQNEILKAFQELLCAAALTRYSVIKVSTFLTQA